MTGTSAAVTNISWTGIGIMVVVIVLGLLALVLSVFVCGRGSWKHQRIDRTAGDVRGGVHVGDPGSVMPRRDAPAHSVDPDASGPDKPLGLVRPPR
ncbi:MAG: hypothetical protein QOG05_165 [Streptosporangiaceae bacterium]|nr:hypothetical protein [Streptosporangiaceae bacterium]